MTDEQFASLKNTILEQSVYNECAITDSIYETHDKLMAKLNEIQDQINDNQRQIQTVDRMCRSIVNQMRLQHELTMAEEYIANNEFIRRMETKLGL